MWGQLAQPCAFGPTLCAPRQGFSGLRLSPTYDKHVRWLDAPGTAPLWAKARTSRGRWSHSDAASYTLYEYNQ
jgi:hypothetical protein